jgi:hypothetical protein
MDGIVARSNLGEVFAFCFRRRLSNSWLTIDTGGGLPWQLSVRDAGPPIRAIASSVLTAADLWPPLIYPPPIKRPSYVRTAGSEEGGVSLIRWRP